MTSPILVSLMEDKGGKGERAWDRACASPNLSNRSQFLFFFIHFDFVLDFFRSLNPLGILAEYEKGNAIY